MAKRAIFNAMITVTRDGSVSGDYWQKLAEFEDRASMEFGQRRELQRMVEFEANIARMKAQNDQRRRSVVGWKYSA